MTIFRGLSIDSSSSSRFAARWVGVLLEPAGRAAGTIGRVFTLRDNAFEAQLAGVAKHGLAVAIHVLVASNAWPSLGQDYSKRGLATLQRIRPEIVTVQFNQVEGVQENAFVMVPVANAIERRDAIVITSDCFPVDDAGARAQAGQCLYDQRETIGEIIARAAVEPHLCARLAGDDPKAIVLDLVQPLAA